MATGRARRRQRYVACRATRVRPDDWFQIPKLPLATWSRNGSSEPRSKRSRLASAADDRSPANAAPHQPATWNQPSRVRGGRLVSRERISTGPSRACSIRTSAAYRLGRQADTTTNGGSLSECATSRSPETGTEPSHRLMSLGPPTPRNQYLGHRSQPEGDQNTRRARCHGSLPTAQ
jgi:hypothetical protein